MPDLAISRDTGNELIDRAQAALNQSLATAATELKSVIAEGLAEFDKRLERLNGATITATIKLGDGK